MSAKREGEAVCDAAAMREALEKTRRVLHCAIVAGILKGDDAYDALNTATAALNAPPRNCDEYATAEEAHFAFCAEPCEKPCGNCTVTNVEMAHDCFIKWLLAPATEQKGEGDGQ